MNAPIIEIVTIVIFLLTVALWKVNKYRLEREAKLKDCEYALNLRIEDVKSLQLTIREKDQVIRELNGRLNIVERAYNSEKDIRVTAEKKRKVVFNKIAVTN